MWKDLRNDWMGVVEGNCEQNLWRNHGYNGEYASSVTAALIIFLGIYSICRCEYMTPLWKIIWWMFIMNGIGSMMFHATMYIGWDLIDSMTLIIGVILGSYKCFNMIILNKYFILNKKIENQQYYYLYNILSIMNDMVHMFLLCVFLAFRALSEGPVSSFVMVLFSMSIVIQYTIAIRSVYEHKSEHFQLTTKYFIHSLILFIIALIIRFTAEIGCEHHVIFLYSFGHAIWHIIASLGLYKLLISLMYIDAFNNQCDPYWKKGIFTHYFCPVLYIKSTRSITILPKKRNQIETQLSEIITKNNVCAPTNASRSYPILRIPNSIRPKK